MSFLLHIETSTNVCSVAISDNEQIISCKETYDGDHVKHLNPLIRDVLDEARFKVKDIAGVAISNGPGSYTSLRAGMAAAKGICFALELPLFQISTLEALCHGGRELHGMDTKSHFVSMLDARRDDVYLAIYNKLGDTIIQPQMFNIEDDVFSLVQLIESETIIVGNAAQKWYNRHPEALCKVLDIPCSASFLAVPANRLFRVGASSDLNSCIPYYMKDPNITSPKAKQS